MAAHGGPGEREATPQSTYEHAGVQGGSASPGVRDWSEAEGGKRRRSRSDKNGSQTHTSPEPLQVHKKIELSACQYARISEQLVELYETGLSLADIAKQTGKAKNSIREILIRAGVSLRGNRSLPVAAAARSKSGATFVLTLDFATSKDGLFPIKGSTSILLTSTNSGVRKRIRTESPSCLTRIRFRFGALLRGIEILWSTF